MVLIVIFVTVGLGVLATRKARAAADFFVAAIGMLLEGPRSLAAIVISILLDKKVITLELPNLTMALL